MTRRPRPLPEGYPTAAQLEAELQRENYRTRYGRTLRSTLYALIIVAAATVLLAMMWLPVLQIYGGSMAPTLNEGDIVAAVKTSDFSRGDIIAFYYNNKILTKRVIAGPGSWVDFGEDGTVYVDGEALEEPYLTDKTPGSCDIELPYQVPDGRYFVLGDHRATSVDSRHEVVGCVAEEQVIGKLTFRIWPLHAVGRPK